MDQSNPNNPIKKRTKSLDTRLRRTPTARTPKPRRYEYQVIPEPANFAQAQNMYRLYGDVILMEVDDTLIIEASVYNHFKVYKHAQIEDYNTQKLVRFHLEDKKNEPLEDWRHIVQKIENSESRGIREWATPIRTYCERHETVMKEFTGQLSEKRLEELQEIGARSEKTRQILMKTYPCLEFKSQFKDGQMQLTELSYSEKYLAELGYTIDEFTTTLFKQGLPVIIPLDGYGASTIAKLRLRKFLTIDPNGYQTPEFESFQIMKDGRIKKVRFITYYMSIFENGTPGFIFIGAMVARQKGALEVPKPIQEIQINEEYLQLKVQREKEQADFLAMYYGFGEGSGVDEGSEPNNTDLESVHETEETAQTEDLDGLE